MTICVKFVRKDKSRLMRIIAWLLARPVPGFMTRFWTTIGRTVYYPVCIDSCPFKDDRFKTVMGHELMHVEQFKKYGMLLMAAAYLLFPLPILFSGRWFIERRPWLYSIQRGGRTPEMAADALWKSYMWPWPKKWMIQWFHNHIDDDIKGKHEFEVFEE